MMIPGAESVERLTREAELDLIRIAHDGDAANALLNTTREMGQVDREWLQQIALAGREAIGKLLQDLESYIHYHSRRWYERTRHRWSFEDCVQHASFGAMHAIRKFDSTNGARLATYATMWIWQALGRMKLIGDVVRRPMHVKDSRLTKSLDVPVGRDDRDLLVTTVASREDSPERELERRDAAAKVRILLKALPPRDQEIVLLRTDHTFREISKKIGISHERVRQLWNRAMQRLKDEASRLGMPFDVAI
jgi:RNA polymerase sigma factor (sigma-70 family)